MKKTRSSSFLSSKLCELGKVTGWQLKQEWSQNTAMIWKEVDEGLIAFLNFLSQEDKQMVEYMKKSAEEKLN